MSTVFSGKDAKFSMFVHEDQRGGVMTRQRKRQVARRSEKGPTPWTKPGPNRKQRRSLKR